MLMRKAPVHRRRITRALAPIALGAALFALAQPAGAADKLKIGVTATLEGTYTPLGEDGMRGFQVALKEFGNKAGGRDIEWIVASTDASPDSAIRAARKLIEQDHVDVLIAPLSGSEGIAMRDFAKAHPDKTIINASSSAQETTYVTPAPNFFRFNSDGAQQQAGLGKYIFDKKGYKKVVTIGEDYSYIYTQVFGFVVGFCQAGGEITKRFWVPLGTKDFASIIDELPDDVDAIYLGLGGGDAVNFLNQYQQAGGNAKLVGGSLMVDQTVLSAKGKAKEALIGTPAAGPEADASDDPKWQAFVKAYQDAFPPDKRFPVPSFLALFYYINTKAALLALNEVGGDLSDGNKNFRAALTKLVLDTPVGAIKLDENRQAIAPNFVTEVTKDANGNLVNKLVETIPNVPQTLGMDPAVFAKIGIPARENPPCKKSY
jgi:ABC-type branched-subunit amino acid transport system substrate-binding protein